MKRVSIPAAFVLAIASTGVVGVAAAQSPTTTPAAVTAQSAINAAVGAIQTAGKAGLISAGNLNFSFTPAGLTCPTGTTNPAYCADNTSGTFRFILRVKDTRPGSSGNYPVIATFLSAVKAATPFSSLTCLPLNAASTGCPLNIRSKGQTILNYAQTNGTALPALLIAHVRPNGSATSTEVLQFLNL